MHFAQKGLRCDDLAGNREYRSMDTDKEDSWPANFLKRAAGFLVVVTKRGEEGGGGVGAST